MSFPVSPTNGQNSVVNGITYSYSTATSSWTRVAGQVTSTTYLSITNTTVASNTTTGAFQVRGGVGIGGDLYVGGTINGTINGNIISGPVGSSTNADNIAVNNVLPSTIYYLALAEDLNGNYSAIDADSTLIYDTATSKVSAKKLAVTDTTASTNTSTGALTVAGGVGVAGNMYVGGTVTATNIYVGPWAVSTGSSAVAVQYFGSSLGSVNTINLTTGTTATVSSNVITIQTENTLLNIDGGSANSVYQSAEVVSGGGA